ncbi:MAG TPA: multiheme c-type cytochrome [Lacipirellulaceae bacterium]|nr:multiheme c-type cytochrome [Lacipirellulaceae bacterium]
MPRLATFRTLLFALAIGITALAGALAWDWYSTMSSDELAHSHYVGSATCTQCHQKEHDLWHGSDHDLAMALATDKTVEADFNNTKFERFGVTTRFFRQGKKFMVNAEGPDGKNHDYEIKYTFGVHPLQQYMVEFPDGRVQVLRESWDVKRKKWFYVTPPDVTNERILPGDPLHWTGIAQNWNTTCADCHSTNVHKNYDPKTNTYKTSWQEINVSCEECHGPGSVHVKLAKRWSPFWDRNVGYGLPPLKNKFLDVQIEMCAKCHSRRYQVHEDFRPGKPFMDYYEPSLLLAGLYQADGQIQDEVYEYGSFLQSKMHANHVICSNCHNPHSLKLKFEGNRLCEQCHDAGKFDTPAHHHHKPGTAGAQCIQCHMPSRYYMVIDERRDHSFRIPRPDLSAKLGTTNACNKCHTKPNETPQWAADAIKKWTGNKTNTELRWGPAFAAGRAAKPEGEKLLLELIQSNSTPSIVRATAIDLLGNYNSKGSIAVRRDALRDSDPLVRLAAVRVLPDSDQQRLVLDLASVINDPIRTVRIATATRLAQLPRSTLTDSQRKDFEKAMVEFRKSQGLSLDHAGAHLMLATFDRQQGRLKDAVDHLFNAIKLEPYLSGPRGELASLLEANKADPDEIRRLRADEAELVERDSKLAPENAEIFYRLGLLRYKLGQTLQADDAFRAACDKAPNNYDYRMALTLLQEYRYGQTGKDHDFQAAVESLKKLRDINPADPRARLILERLLTTWHTRNPNAEPDVGKK